MSGQSGSAFLSQHNIMGSEAFNRRPFVIIRNLRAGSFRRRKNRSVVAYVVVAVLALSAGAAAAFMALAPGLADAEIKAAAAPAAPQPALPVVPRTN